MHTLTRTTAVAVATQVVFALERHAGVATIDPNFYELNTTRAVT